MERSDSVIGAALRARMRDRRRSEETGEELCTLDFDPGFPGFDGHFPGNPIVPGVCLIAAARVFAEEVLGLPLEVAEIRQCRFRRPVQAGERAEVHLRIAEPEPGVRQVQASITVDGSPAAQLRLKAVAK